MYNVRMSKENTESRAEYFRKYRKESDKKEIRSIRVPIEYHDTIKKKLQVLALKLTKELDGLSDE